MAINKSAKKETKEETKKYDIKVTRAKELQNCIMFAKLFVFRETALYLHVAINGLLVALEFCQTLLKCLVTKRK